MDADPGTAVTAAEVDGRVVPGPPPSRRRRWQKWIILFLLLLAIRLALPIVAAPYLAAHLSRGLGTLVEIGDLSFQPIDALVTLRRVTVHPPPGMPADATPPIVARRVRIDVQWLPLLHQQLHIRELAFESARIDLDRFADGHFGLGDLERADPASALPPEWSLGLDRIVWRDSVLRVRDLATEETSRLEVTLRSASVAGIRRRASAFGKAPNLHVDALVGGGQLRVRGRFEIRDDGLVLDALLRVKDVPLAQAKQYVADLGWSDIAGQVSGQLRWQREPRRRDVLSGRVILRRGRVQVAGLTEPALAVRRGIADIGAIDLLARRIAIRSVTLRGATVAFQPAEDAPVPLLAPLPPRFPLRMARDASATRGGALAGWDWMVERYETVDGRLRVLNDDGRFDVRAQVSGENLGPDAYWSPLRINARRRDTVAAFDGTVRLNHGVVIEGRLTAGGIDLPSLARVAAIPWADLVQSGRATADLTVQLDTATTDASPLFFRGDISCSDVWIAGPDPSMLALGSTAVDLTLERYQPREPPHADGRAGQPARIKFSAAQVSAPYLLLTRTSDGWVLPPFTTPTDGAATPTPTMDSPEQASEISFGTLHVNAGRAIVVDLLPASTVTWQLNRMDGTAQQLALPQLSFDAIALGGSDQLLGPLQLRASRPAETFSFELSGDAVPLPSITPYLRLAGLAYSFASGSGSFTARGDIHAASWTAAADMTLHGAVLIGSDALQMTIGMPARSALAMLRDANGDIPIRLALSSPATGGPAPLAEQVAAGIRDTIHGVTKIAAAPARDGTNLPMVSLPFAPGQVHLPASAMQDLAPVAALLGARPGLVAELSATASQQDRRWLAEQALLARLEDSGGIRGVLRALGVQDARARIRTALAARTHGAPGLLDSDDEETLARLLAEAPPVPEHQLDALREARLLRVVSHLAEHYGITGGRVIVQPPTARETDHRADVRVQVAIGREATGPLQDRP